MGSPTACVWGITALLLPMPSASKACSRGWRVKTVLNSVVKHWLVHHRLCFRHLPHRLLLA